MYNPALCALLTTAQSLQSDGLEKGRPPIVIRGAHANPLNPFDARRYMKEGSTPAETALEEDGGVYALFPMPSTLPSASLDVVRR